MNSWYEALNKPPLTPPNWIFSPVWTVLYVMIAVSIILYYRTPSKQHPIMTTAVLLIHLLTNIIWTFLFFRLKSPGSALIDIIILDISLIFLILWFWKARPSAGILLIPYLLWILFATYLNFAFYVLN
jgi:tryptophan-rich sensory protein